MKRYALAILLVAVAAPVPAHQGVQTMPIAARLPMEGDLHPGQDRHFALTLAKGDFVRGWVDQLGVSIRVALIGPGGLPIRAYQGLSRGKSSFAFVAGSDGRYELALSATEKAAGKYRLLVEQIVPAGAKEAPKEAIPESPRLAALLRDLRGDGQAIEAFWSEVARSGTPLVEPIDERHFRVTFLWRGADAHDVQLVWALPPFGETHELRRLAGTDIWYRSETLPRGARFTYKLAADTLAGAGGVAAVATADPLNERQYRDSPETDRYSLASIGELPGASPQPWAEARGAPKGKVEQSRFVSAILGNDRPIAVYTPPGYRPDGPPADLLILFDAEAYLDRIPAPLIVDNLIAAGKIAPTLILLIGNSAQEARLAELGGNPKFSDFVTAEILPWVRNRYNVTRDSGRTIIGGSSFGGLAAGYIAFRHPELFGKVLAQSGSFWWSPTRNPFDPARLDEYSEPGWLIRQFADAPTKPILFYLDAGWFEGGEGGGILDTNRYFRDILRAKGYQVHYREFVGGHDYINWRGTLGDGLIALAGDGG